MTDYQLQGTDGCSESARADQYPFSQIGSMFCAMVSET